MAGEQVATERVLGVLRPYASNWTGTLGRGDLVIPQRDIPRLIHEILEAVREDAELQEVGDLPLVEALLAAQRCASAQDRADFLRKRFRILPR